MTHHLPAGADYDDAFSLPTLFVPIDREAMNGKRQLVRRGSNYAAGQWTGDFWSYPYDGEGGASHAERMSFIPTHYAARDAAGGYVTMEAVAG